MRIRLWNAFASNNSGSYTIVGSFRDPAAAAAVAAELQALCDTESAWQRQQWDKATRGEERPLVAFARQLGVADAEKLQHDGDDWPDLGYAPSPRVTHTDHQVVLHVPYTVSMPSVLGQFLYHHGGRVDVEIDHAHEPLVVDHQLWASWKDPDRNRRLHDALTGLLAPDSALHEHAAADVVPVVLLQDEHGAAVRALAVFTDVVAGIAAMAQFATGHGLELRVRLLEAEPGDPLRPWRST